MQLSDTFDPWAIRELNIDILLMSYTSTYI